MSFTQAWLDLRAPADAAARDARLLAAAAAHVSAVKEPVVVDLGSGTGASVAAFAGAAPSGTRWRLIDNDLALLDCAARRFGPSVEICLADLGALEALPIDDAQLVTASALFDLMPPGWIERLADRLAAMRTGIYAALSYEGRLAWEPPMPADARIVAAFNAHQRRDKGLGPAAGPEGAARLAAALRQRGFAVETGPSPWHLGAERAALHRELVAGIAAAAAEMGAEGAERWAQARRAASFSGSACVVGHVDVLALPPEGKAQSNTTSVSSP